MLGFDRTLERRTPPARPEDKPKQVQTHFRVHLSDGSKHDVLAASAVDASKHVGKRYPDLKITKTKVVREQVPA